MKILEMESNTILVKTDIFIIYKFQTKDFVRYKLYTPNDTMIAEIKAFIVTLFQKEYLRLLKPQIKSSYRNSISLSKLIDLIIYHENQIRSQNNQRLLYRAN